MPIEHHYDGAALVPPASVQLADEREGFRAIAAGLEEATITVIVDDSAGALDFVDYKTWRIKETDGAAGNQVMWAGFIGDQAIGRGKGAVKFPTGTGRRWVLELHEVNEFAKRRVLRTGANRLSETVSTRAAWLLTATGFTGGLIVDHGLVEASAVVMDPFDYTNQYGEDVLNSMAVACGFTPHIRYREASNDYELIFLDFKRSPLDLSTLKISNAGDHDYATIWPPNDCTLRRSRERRWSGAAMPYAGGGSVYRQRAATQAEIGDVDGVFPANDVKTAATATTLTDRLLVQQANSEETIEDLTIWLPAANVNDVLKGQQIQAKFTHLPGWTSYRLARVLEKTPRRSQNLTQAGYDVDLKLAPQLATTASGIQITSPVDDPPGEYQGSGVIRIGWVDDGDNPRGGATPYAKFGLFSYVGAIDNRTAIQCDGTGLIDLRLAFSVSLVVTGDHTFTATIRRNGTIVATATQVSSGGARSQQWEIGGAAGVGTELTASDVPVHNGDIIEAYCLTSAGTPVDVIPTGVGNVSHWLWATGELVA